MDGEPVGLGRRVQAGDAVTALHIAAVVAALVLCGVCVAVLTRAVVNTMHDNGGE